MIKRLNLFGDLILVLVALVWGLTLVFQKSAMENIGAYYFNGFRFILGSLFIGFIFLLSIIFFSRRFFSSVPYKRSFSSGVVVGLVITSASLFQQVGLIYTTPTKAGFLTGFYVFFTPFLAWIFHKKPNKNIWISMPILLLGLFLLTIKTDYGSLFLLNFGDGLQLFGAFFWAVHLVVVAKVVRRVNILFFSFVQFLIVGLMSLLIGLFFNEPLSWSMVELTKLEIIYSGVGSVGIAYTLQIVGQKLTTPSKAALILSLESIAASFFSWIMLGEILTVKEYLGCALIFAGILWTEIKTIHQ